MILNKVIKIRSQYPSLKKAAVYANDVLPAEPQSLVEKYLVGKERPSKEYVVASRKSRFSTPALPVSRERTSDSKPCACKGKCATRKCDCRAMEVLCNNKCKCKVAKCINRE